MRQINRIIQIFSKIFLFSIFLNFNFFSSRKNVEAGNNVCGSIFRVRGFFLKLKILKKIFIKNFN